MNTSSRFAVAVHTLTLLAHVGDEPVTSEMIAGSVNTNPVVIRRILGYLRRAGLVTSQPGNGGGWRLVGCPERITLRDVHRAVEEEVLFPLHSQPPNPNCAVGRHIQQALEGYFAQASAAMEDRLARVSIGQVLRAVLARAG